MTKQYYKHKHNYQITLNVQHRIKKNLVNTSLSNIVKIFLTKLFIQKISLISDLSFSHLKFIKHYLVLINVFHVVPSSYN